MFNERAIARSLTPDEVVRLTSIDQKFWSHEMTTDGKSQARSALAVVYDPVPNWKFFDLVKNVFVPSSIEERVRAIAGDKLIVL